MTSAAAVAGVGPVAWERQRADGEEVSPATSTMASFEEVASGVEVKRQELVDLATATEKSGCQLSRSSGSLSEEPQATSSC